jgi:CHAT domain-containing protein
MPSLSALTALSAAKATAASRAFLGVGDPKLLRLHDPSVQPSRRGLPPDLLQVLSSLSELPETSAELSRIAALFPADLTRLMLREDATKRALRDASAESYRFVEFATHAVMSGELPGVAEPAIILTSATNVPTDGFLTASEIAAMTFNADLVLLSACNTAAPDGGPFSEGLSGLARAFLHAGARSMLVSHWAVNNVATVELTTGFMAALQSDPARNKADALRVAMLALLDSDNVALRHPSIWAPFVIVGR